MLMGQSKPPCERLCVDLWLEHSEYEVVSKAVMHVMEQLVMRTIIIKNLKRKKADVFLLTPRKCHNITMMKIS